jgi:hypothetical protein
MELPKDNGENVMSLSSAMQEIEKLVIFAHMTAQGYPQDYTEGFIDALFTDKAAAEDRANQLCKAIIAQASEARHGGLIGDVIETAIEVMAISQMQKNLEKKIEAARRLSGLLDLKEEGTFGSRIAYRKISDVASLLKSETC